jgi:MFS family permease
VTAQPTPAAPVPPGTRAAAQRRILRVLVASQILSGAGLAAGVTVGALLAEDMLGSTGLAGLPSALFTLGSAGAALLVGRLSDRAGRRAGLAAGYATGAVGCAGTVLAAVVGSVPLLFAALLLYGSGTATNLQARYAGADLAEPSRRGRAVSTVLVATTLGAVAGPNLVDVTGKLAAAAGIPALAGPFALAAVAYALAAAVLLVFLRPDPLVTARRLDAGPVAAPSGTDEPGPGSPPGRPAGSIRFAATAMVVTQIVMVAIMTMTPIHMRDHHHGLAAAGFVIAVHVACMFLPSPLTGNLADRFGRRPVIAAGGITLLAAGILAAAAPVESVPALAVALGLLGLGWNLGLVGGTAMVTDVTPVRDRARTQGTVDLAVALAGATGGMTSGLVVAMSSFSTLALAGGCLALVMLPTLLATGRRRSAA